MFDHDVADGFLKAAAGEHGSQRMRTTVQSLTRPTVPRSGYRHYKAKTYFIRTFLLALITDRCVRPRETRHGVPANSGFKLVETDTESEPPAHGAGYAARRSQRPSLTQWSATASAPSFKIVLPLYQKDSRNLGYSHWHDPSAVSICDNRATHLAWMKRSSTQHEHISKTLRPRSPNAPIRTGARGNRPLPEDAAQAP